MRGKGTVKTSIPQEKSHYSKHLTKILLLNAQNLFLEELTRFCQELTRFCQELTRFCQELTRFCQGLTRFCQELTRFCQGLTRFCQELTQTAKNGTFLLLIYRSVFRGMFGDVILNTYFCIQ